MTLRRRTDDRTDDDTLLQPPLDRFDATSLDTVAEPVRRYLRWSIADGTPIWRSARVRMRGHIRLGRWMPFRATEALDPHHGFVWRARVAAGLVSGWDRFVTGAGSMDWRLAGLVPVMRASGPDVSRSAAARAGGEAVWLPTALLPGPSVEWSVEGDVVEARFSVADASLALRQRVDATGRASSAVIHRWGDPDGTGAWGLHPFGGDLWAHRTFHGLTIPTAGRFGWHYGTDRWPDGEFFRYEITHLEPCGADGRGSDRRGSGRRGSGR